MNSGRHVDDRAGAALTHLRNDRLGHCHHADCVGFDKLPDERHRHCFKRADTSDAGILYKDIHQACRFHKRGNAPSLVTSKGNTRSRSDAPAIKRGVGLAHGGEQSLAT